VPVLNIPALERGSYLSYPSFREVKVLIYLAYLKRLRVLRGIKEKSFRFSNLILSIYSLLLSNIYFTA